MSITAADSTVSAAGEASGVTVTTTPRARRNVTFNVSTQSGSDPNVRNAGDGSAHASLTDAGGVAPRDTFLMSADSYNSARRGSHSAAASQTSNASSYTAYPSNTHGGGSVGDGATAAAPPLFTLTHADVQAAFEFFDVQGTGSLTISSLKPRLSAFYPNLTSKEYRFLLEDPVSVGGGSEPTSAHGTPGSGGGLGGSAGGVTGFTADHLWELIDTYQRLYAGSVPPMAGSAGSSMTGLRHPSPPPSRSGHRRPQNSTSRTTPERAPASLHSPRSGNSTAKQTSGGQGPAIIGFPSAFDVPDASPLACPPYSTTTAPHAAGTGLNNARSNSTAGGAGASINATQIFDPVYEAFRVFDPTGRKRCVDTDILAQLMARIGYGELSDEELSLLVRTADYDGDGKISLDDFRRLVSAKGRLGGGSWKER